MIEFSVRSPSQLRGPSIAQNNPSYPDLSSVDVQVRDVKSPVIFGTFDRKTLSGTTGDDIDKRTRV